MASAAAELGKEGLGGWRMVRAVWQVEGDVFELHVSGFAKSGRLGVKA